METREAPSLGQPCPSPTPSLARVLLARNARVSLFNHAHRPVKADEAAHYVYRRRRRNHAFVTFSNNILLSPPSFLLYFAQINGHLPFLLIYIIFPPTHTSISDDKIISPSDYQPPAGVVYRNFFLSSTIIIKKYVLYFPPLSHFNIYLSLKHRFQTIEYTADATEGPPRFDHAVSGTNFPSLALGAGKSRTSYS